MHEEGAMEVSKPKEIYIDGYDFYFWDYEPQTKMKHLVLNEYFLFWAHKLGKYYNPCFFDCHGGCGSYLENNIPQWGSSVLLARSAEEIEKQYGKKVDIFVCEMNKDYFDNLNKVIAFNRLGEKIKTTNQLFEDIIYQQQIKEYFELHPTLFFVDPFGYTLKIKDIVHMLSFSKSEVIFNFMYNFINRSVSIDAEEEKMNKLFGCDDWKKAYAMTGLNRELFLIDLFKRQIKKLSGIKYIFPYRLSFYDKNRTYYYLFHMTNNYSACAVMKSCFAKHNYGKVEYLGNRSGILSLFDMDFIKTQEIENYLIGRYKEKKIAFKKICEDIIDETYFLEKDIRTAIKEMKKNGKVTVIPVTSATDKGLRELDIVTFNGDIYETIY